MFDVDWRRIRNFDCGSDAKDSGETRETGLRHAVRFGVAGQHVGDSGLSGRRDRECVIGAAALRAECDNGRHRRDGSAETVCRSGQPQRRNDVGGKHQRRQPEKDPSRRNRAEGCEILCRNVLRPFGRPQFASFVNRMHGSGNRP